MINLLEFAFGTDPLLGNRFFKLGSLESEGTGKGGCNDNGSTDRSSKVTVQLKNSAKLRAGAGAWEKSTRIQW